MQRIALQPSLPESAMHILDAELSGTAGVGPLPKMALTFQDIES
jgi:hypothetical protein